MNVTAFHHISIKRNGLQVPYRLTVITFLSLNISHRISIFKVTFEITPNIRSLVQCLKCNVYDLITHKNYIRANSVTANVATLITMYHFVRHSSFIHFSAFIVNPIIYLQNDLILSIQHEDIMATDNVSYNETVQLKCSSFVNKTIYFTDITNTI